MRTPGKYFLIAVLLLPFLSLSQDKGERMLAWDSYRKLEWRDYQGKPDTESDAAASTATYLGFEYKIRNNDFSYKISCYFSIDKSWGVVKNGYILGHEQGHFDIAEIHARKLNKKMKEYQFDKKSFRSELEKIYNNIQEEKDLMQNSYDIETNYSRNKEKQAEWSKKIENLLADLISYSGYNQNSP